MCPEVCVEYIRACPELGLLGAEATVTVNTALEEPPPPPPLGVSQERTPFPSVFKYSPLDPSVAGRVRTTLPE